MVKGCCFLNCTNNKKNRNLSFYPIPNGVTESERRKVWLEAINRIFSLKMVGQWIGTESQFEADPDGITNLSTMEDDHTITPNPLTPPSRQLGKVFNDSIHGHIELPSLCVKIIDTPQFQRLRNIKQLGGCYFLFPGASHNRFEHSLGVCHLAGEMVRVLRFKQPELGIKDQDVLCVEIAGLCHDLGHGPFSHMFDGTFIPEILPGIKWKHEQASCDMFEHLIAENDLDKEWTRNSLSETDKKFVAEMILQPYPSPAPQDWPYKGRQSNKAFLYEIVSNSRNGVDVDKWDYFARDCHHLGIGNSFDWRRMLKSARAIEVDGLLQICYQKKEALNIYDMFYTRLSLHRRAYQHRVPMVIEHMITDAMVAANDHIEILGNEGTTHRMSECIDNMYAFTNLTDHVFYQILYSQDPNLDQSRSILRDLLSRKLYSFIGQTPPIKLYPASGTESKNISIKEIRRVIVKSGMNEEDIITDVITMDYGCKSSHGNPIDRMNFYEKDDLNYAFPISQQEVSLMLPGVFGETTVHVYSRSNDEKRLHDARRDFKRLIDQRRAGDDTTRTTM